MKIQIINSTFIDGVARDPGEVVDVPQGTAELLIGINVAKAYSEPAAAPAEQAPEAPAP